MSRLFSKSRLLLLGLVLSSLSISTAGAALLGPTTAPPGGGGFTGSGTPPAGSNGSAAVWNYGGFDASAFDSLFWGLNQIDHGVACGSLRAANVADCQANDPFVYQGITGTTARWQSTSDYRNPTTGNVTNEQIYLSITVTDSAGGSWVDGAALDTLLGPGHGLGSLGALWDNSDGSSFSVLWEMRAFGTGGTYLNNVQINPGADGGLRTHSSLAVGMYYTPAAVPVPAAVWLFGTAMLGMIGLVRAKKQPRA